MQGAAKSEPSGPGASQQAEAPAPASDRASADARDRALIRQLKAGDQRAFEELVRIYQDRVFSLSLRMIGNRQEAEDLAQEVFMTVHRAIASYRGEGRFYTWLYRIASNTCKNRIKYLRGRHFHRSVPVDETPEAQVPAGEAGPGVPLQSRVHGPEAMTEGNRLEAAVQRELAALDPEHRLLIVLRDVQGLSYQEILRITGLQEGTLKSRLHRARVALKDRLKPHLA
ncbi:MAG: sigma-70 family RNA polymerase sigma factor [Nannocystaceae bacterium]|nr:sigma-70 family RNA polymerase sigma factor [bacterium]